jgi:hypothetical protein
MRREQRETWPYGRQVKRYFYSGLGEAYVNSDLRFLGLCVKSVKINGEAGRRSELRLDKSLHRSEL